MSLRPFLASAAVGLSLSMGAAALAQSSAPAAAPIAATGDPVAAAIEAYQAAAKTATETKTGRERFEAMNEAAADALATIKFDTVAIDGFEKLADARLLGRANPDTMVQIDERLATLAKDNGETGARAAMLRATFNPIRPTDDESRKAAQAEGKSRTMAALTHPGLPAAVQAGKAQWLLASPLRAEQADAAYLDALTRIVDLPLPPESVGRLWGAFMPLADDKATVNPEARERLRLAFADKIAKTIGTASEGGDATAPAAGTPATPEAIAKDRQRQMLESHRKNFEGAFAKGKLVGHTAPEIAFDWSDLPGGATKLSDLKGKVVVIDFWAVWCGPCIASFPQVRDLQARYKDFPVVVLGITDMQGTPRPQVAPGEAIEWKPEVQFPALAAWAKEKDMTWPIAVGSDSVFNPDYGVNGIPHVVIIDPEGKVRYRGMHPASEPEKKHGYIDGLLKEFNLPHPAN